MAEYRVVLIDGDNNLVAKISKMFKDMNGFSLVASYREANEALAQSVVFRPNLFLIDIDNEESRHMVPAFLDLYPDAKLLGLMDKWEADRAFEIFRIGALGCLVKPFDGEKLSEAIRVFSRGHRAARQRTMVFFSPKGNCGKTTFLGSLALALAEKSGEVVAMVDADLQFSDLPIFFDIAATTSIVEATSDVKFLSPIMLNTYFLPVANNLQLLCGPKRLEYFEMVDIESLTAVVRMAQTLYRYVLIDLPSGISPFSVGMCELADTTFLLGAERTGFETGHMRRAMDTFQGWENYGKRIHVVFSGMEPANNVAKARVEKAIAHPVTELLPYDAKLRNIVNSGDVTKEMRKDSAYKSTVYKLADDIIQNKL